MTRATIVLAAAVAVVLLTGFVHGTWTQRWHHSTEVDEAVARLNNIPTRVGGWTAGDVEPFKPEVLKAAGAEGCWMHSFTLPATGQKLLVVILCGHTGQMCVHRPENCYPGQGYDLAAAPLHENIKMADGAPNAQFLTARFVKPEVTTGSSQLHIYWTWNAAGRWQAPDYPRWTFASQPFLYKIYVIRVLPADTERQGEDPTAEFLRQFLPVLNKALAP